MIIIYGKTGGGRLGQVEFLFVSLFKNALKFKIQNETKDINYFKCLLLIKQGKKKRKPQKLDRTVAPFSGSLSKKKGNSI